MLLDAYLARLGVRVSAAQHGTPALLQTLVRAQLAAVATGNLAAFLPSAGAHAHAPSLSLDAAVLADHVLQQQQLCHGIQASVLFAALLDQLGFAVAVVAAERVAAPPSALAHAVLLVQAKGAVRVLVDVASVAERVCAPLPLSPLAQAIVTASGVFRVESADAQLQLVRLAGSVPTVLYRFSLAACDAAMLPQDVMLRLRDAMLVDTSNPAPVLDVVRALPDGGFVRIQGAGIVFVAPDGTTTPSTIESPSALVDVLKHQFRVVLCVPAAQLSSASGQPPVPQRAPSCATSPRAPSLSGASDRSSAVSVATSLATSHVLDTPPTLGLGSRVRVFDLSAVDDAPDDAWLYSPSKGSSSRRSTTAAVSPRSLASELGSPPLPADAAPAAAVTTTPTARRRTGVSMVSTQATAGYNGDEDTRSTTAQRAAPILATPTSAGSAARAGTGAVSPLALAGDTGSGSSSRIATPRSTVGSRLPTPRSPPRSPPGSRLPTPRSAASGRASAPGSPRSSRRAAAMSPPPALATGRRVRRSLVDPDAAAPGNKARASVPPDHGAAGGALLQDRPKDSTITATDKGSGGVREGLRDGRQTAGGDADNDGRPVECLADGSKDRQDASKAADGSVVERIDDSSKDRQDASKAADGSVVERIDDSSKDRQDASKAADGNVVERIDDSSKDRPDASKAADGNLAERIDDSSKDQQNAYNAADHADTIKDDGKAVERVGDNSKDRQDGSKPADSSKDWQDTSKAADNNKNDDNVVEQFDDSSKELQDGSKPADLGGASSRNGGGNAEAHGDDANTGGRSDMQAGKTVGAGNGQASSDVAIRSARASASSTGSTDAAALKRNMLAMRIALHRARWVGMALGAPASLPQLPAVRRIMLDRKDNTVCLQDQAEHSVATLSVASIQQATPDGRLTCCIVSTGDAGDDVTYRVEFTDAEVRDLWLEGIPALRDTLLH